MILTERGRNMKTKHASGLLRARNYLPWVFYVAAVLMVALMQISPRFFPTVSFAHPVPLVVFTVCVAVLEGPTMGAVIGVIAGLLWDMHSLRIFGYYGLMLLLIGLAVGLLVQWLLRANFLSAMLLSVSGVLVYTIMDWLICYVLFLRDEMSVVLIKVYLPNAVYTIVLAPIVYWCVLLMARFLRRKK